MHLDIGLLCDDLCAKRWSYWREVITRVQRQSLLHDFEILRVNGRFQAATVGAAHDRIDQIRSDWILWLDPSVLSAENQWILRDLDSLRQQLNQRLFQNMTSVESHFSYYPAGGYYEKHIDQLKGKESRVLSFIIYLNENWDSTRNGGHLRIFEGESGYTDLEPVAGSFVCFVSDQVAHQVLPTMVERRSLTGWLRRSRS